MHSVDDVLLCGFIRCEVLQAVKESRIYQYGIQQVKAAVDTIGLLMRLRSCQSRNVDLSAIDFVIGIGRLLFDPVTSYNSQSHRLTGPLLPEYIQYEYFKIMKTAQFP
jgi:hypothetical protein